MYFDIKKYNCNAWTEFKLVIQFVSILLLCEIFTKYYAICNSITADLF